MVLGFGILIASLLILFKLAEFSYLRTSSGTEIWIAVISLVFFGIGIFISRRYLPAATTKKETIDPKQVGLSKREYEILQLINDGLSNQQIADKLFVSENTVKKHVSNLFLKLDVQRRTEAIKKAKDLNILS